MKQAMKILMIGAALALSATAQTYSQPVRDVNDPGRNAINATCYMSWISHTGNNSCTLYTVPTGKKLIIRDFDISCSMASENNVPSSYLSQAGSLKRLNLLMNDVDAGSSSIRTKFGGRAMFYTVDAGPVYAGAWLVGSPATYPNCVATMFGHLADAQ